VRLPEWERKGGIVATLIQKVKLLQGLLGGEVARAGPFFVDIDLSQRCNLHCLGCLYHSPDTEDRWRQTPSPADMPADLFGRLCQELATMGTHSLVLQGAGEPMLHPRLAELIAMAKAQGFHVTLITNGTLLDRANSQALIDARLDTLVVSLWASSAEEYELNHPGADPNDFERPVAGLRQVASLKAEQERRRPALRVHFPLNRNNYESIEAMVDLAHDTGCDALSFSPFMAAWGALASFELSPDQVQSAQAGLRGVKDRLDPLGLSGNVDEILLRYGLGREAWRKLPCYIGWIHARIRVDGRVQPCGRCDAGMVLGNVKERPFPEVWNGPALRAFRRKTLTSAGVASLFDHCECGYCCFVRDNMRVHRLFRWFAPLARRLRG
jgi:MoaA/NifB/PqqE/SkfB family radical SAM enzyme